MKDLELIQKELAAEILELVTDLNAAIEDATESGLRVELETINVSRIGYEAQWLLNVSVMKRMP